MGTLQVEDVLFSTYPACTKPDTEGPHKGKPFRAQVQPLEQAPGPVRNVLQFFCSLSFNRVKTLMLHWPLPG